MIAKEIAFSGAHNTHNTHNVHNVHNARASYVSPRNDHSASEWNDL